MTERFWKFVYRLRLRRRYENIDQVRYLKRLGAGKQKNDMWYYSYRDADQYGGDEVVIHSRFRGKSVFFYCNPKIHVEQKIIRCGLYEQHSLELIADLLEPRANMIIDVGANIGAVTIPLAKAFPDIEVHAFEPNPLAIERLQRNIVLNKTTNVVLHPVGVGAKPGKEQLHTASCSEIGNSSFLKPAGSAGEDKSIAIDVETLDNCFGVSARGGVNGRVGLIKIDVQGYERQVLNGATALVLRDRPYIVFEHQDENFASLEEARDAKHWFLQFFRDNGYTVLYQTRHDASMMFPVKWDRPLNGNLLAIPTTP